MKMMKLLVLSVAVFFSCTSFGGTVAGFGGATEITQLANNVQLAASYAEHAQQTVTQLNQYATMLRNLQKLTPISALQLAAQKLWQNQNMNQTFKDLYSIVNNGQKIAYSAQLADRQLRTLNPGYGNALAGFDIQKAYKNWSDSTNQALSSALSLSASHAEDFQSEADLMSTLSSMSDSVDGQLQAISAGNQIGIAMVGQMQKLRQIQMAQVNAQTMTEYNNQARRDVSDAQIRKAIDGSCSKMLTPEEARQGRSCK